MFANHSSPTRGCTCALLSLLLVASLPDPGGTSAGVADDANPECLHSRADPPHEGFIWPSRPPEDCPFEASKEYYGVYFTGRHHDRNYGDTWYPSWAVDGNLYSPWTDGNTEGHGCFSIGIAATTGHSRTSSPAAS